MSAKILFFSRNDCPLCEDIEEKLLSSGCEYQFIDIDEDKSLLKTYHVRIPVLKKSNIELAWPFTDEQLFEFVK
jgi:glutaredoxin-related protein